MNKVGSVQSWPKKFVLGCVISPLLRHAESRNLGHTFLANSVVRFSALCNNNTNRRNLETADAMRNMFDLLRTLSPSVSSGVRHTLFLMALVTGRGFTRTFSHRCTGSFTHFEFPAARLLGGCCACALRLLEMVRFKTVMKCDS